MTCQRGAFTLGTSYSKRCYGNSNVKARLYSLSSDIFNMYLFSVTEQEPTDPKS